MLEVLKNLGRVKNGATINEDFDTFLDFQHSAEISVIVGGHVIYDAPYYPGPAAHGDGGTQATFRFPTVKEHHQPTQLHLREPDGERTYVFRVSAYHYVSNHPAVDREDVMEVTGWSDKTSWRNILGDE